MVAYATWARHNVIEIAFYGVRLMALDRGISPGISSTISSAVRKDVGSFVITQTPATDGPIVSSRRIPPGGSRIIDGRGKLNTVVRRIFPPTIHVRSVYPLEGHLHYMCLLILSNGDRLLLKCSPRPTTPLLRQEQLLLETEARAIALLAQSAVPCVPSLLHYDPQGNMLGSAFSIRHFVDGTTLDEMETQLTDQNREEIDRSLGCLANRIGQHISHSFGSLGQVACGSGKGSWREAFVALFEGILRDAEDVFVNLPYAEIRHHVTRLSPALEEVTLARLVVIDFGRSSQVLLDPESKQLSGVVDFSNALWGDIYMAEIFEDPSSAMLDGFGLCPRTSQSDSIRQLLYACYRSVQKITVQYYRDRNTTAENNARRRLTTILTEMAAS